MTGNDKAISPIFVFGFDVNHPRGLFKKEVYHTDMTLPTGKCKCSAAIAGWFVKVNQPLTLLQEPLDREFISVSACLTAP